jgi:hypothetical protein
MIRRRFRAQGLMMSGGFRVQALMMRARFRV